MVALLRLELRRMASDKRFLLLMLALPVAFYLLFTNTFGAGGQQGAGGLNVNVGLMVSMAAYGAIGAALIATGPRVATERANGWMRQLRIMPIRARDVLAAKVIAAMVWAAPAIVLVDVVAVVDHGVSMATWRWLAIGALLWLGTAPFAALGLLIGYLTDENAAFPVMFGCYLFLGAAGGLWMPASVLPGAMQHLAVALPSNRLAEFGWRLAAHQALSPSGAAILVGWLAAFAGLAVLAYRHSTARR